MIENLTAELIALLNWMVAIYTAHTGADEYWFGFVVDHLLYVVPHMTLDALRPFFRMEKASTSKGGMWKIRLRARANELRELTKTAILLGSENLLTTEKNKGDALEKVLAERFAEEQWTKHDSTEFFLAGDLLIDGKQVQVKFNGATLTDEKVLRRNFG